jgi:hypothetical protein
VKNESLAGEVKILLERMSDIGDADVSTVLADGINCIERLVLRIQTLEVKLVALEDELQRLNLCRAEAPV